MPERNERPDRDQDVSHMTVSDYERIVTNFSQPLLVLAGPGSGKTHLLADRVVRLLASGVDKENITVLTYTTDANHNMIDKLTDRTDGFGLSFDELPHVSTIHSLGLGIVQEDPRGVNLLKKNLAVQPNEEVKRLIYRDAALLLGLSEEDAEAGIECKQHGDCNPEHEETRCLVCLKYWEIMSKCNRLDFDDQILFACRILDGNPEILEKYQSRAEHLLVDEYQDINAAQFSLIELLSRKSRSGVFVVGDDAQSIYGFRGGDPRFILRFKEDFPTSQVATLRVSRRCHKSIMDSAFAVLEKYYTDWTGRQDLEFLTDAGPEPFIYHVPSEISEAKLVAAIAKSSVQEKKDVLILAPKRDFFPLIAKELSKRGLYPDCDVSFLPPRFEIAERFLRWLEAHSDNFLTRLIVEDLINTGIARVPGANKRRLSSRASLEKRVAAETEIARLWECVDRKTDLFSVIKTNERHAGALVLIQA